MIKFTKTEHTAIISLNRPDKRNALNPEMISQIKTKLKEIENDDSVQSLIITGEGKSFCAGADLEYLNELSGYSTVENIRDSENLASLLLAIHKFPKLSLAAVNGPAIAGGCGLASVCDIIIADEQNAKFGYSEVKIGFIPAIVSVFLIKKIGEGKAKRLLLSGEILAAGESYKAGLVDYLSNNVMETAYELSAKLSKNSQSSFRLIKEMMNSISSINIEDTIDYLIKLNVISRSTEDFRNGIQNFLNKK